MAQTPVMDGNSQDPDRTLVETQLAARRHFCEEELRLSQALAPGLHLRVEPVCGTRAQPRIGWAERGHRLRGVQADLRVQLPVMRTKTLP